MLQSMATRRDVDVVTYSRGMFPTRYFRFGQQPIDAEFDRSPGIGRLNEPLVEGTARKLKAGEIGAIYTHRMEFGPRALGARTILANPARRETHDLLNTRVERSEFMPCAPVIQSEKASQVFDIKNVNRRACRYMTIAWDVHPE